MAVNDAARSRRKSVAVVSQNELERPKRRRRAHSTAAGDLSPVARSRLSLGPVKSILKGSLNFFRAQTAPPEGSQIEPNSQSLDDSNATQSMDITQDLRGRIHDNDSRKSLARRVSFAEQTYIRVIPHKDKDKRNSSMSSSGSPESSPGRASSEPPLASPRALSNENDYPGSNFRRRDSIRQSTGSDMDLTMIASFRPNRESNSGLSEDEEDGASMELTEAFDAKMFRKRSMSTGRPRISFGPDADVSMSFTDEPSVSEASDVSSAIEYTVPLGQALKPASKDETWLALKNMTHASGSESENPAADGSYDEGSSMEVESVIQGNLSLSSNEDSMDADVDGDQTVNLTEILARRSLGGTRMSLGMPDNDSTMDISEVYGQTAAPTSQKQANITPVSSMPAAPRVFQQPPENSVFRPPTQSTPRARTPSVTSASKPKSPGFSAAFAPPVSRTSPKKPSAPGPTPRRVSEAVAGKRPHPGDSDDATRPSPAKRIALADKWQSASEQPAPQPAAQPTPLGNSRPKQLSPSKRAPFQPKNAQDAPQKPPSGIRRPSGYFAQRKSLGVPSVAPPPKNMNTPSSPKKKAHIGIGRASTGSMRDENEPESIQPPKASTIHEKQVNDNAVSVVVDIRPPLLENETVDLSQILDTPTFGEEEHPQEMDHGATAQWREKVDAQAMVEDEGPPISIEQFLEMTDIKFMTELTAPRRSIHPSQGGNMQARSHSEIPLAEYTVSTTIDAPQLLLYTRVAEDLQAWMVKSKAEFVIAEEEAAKMTPELFTEFSRADEESQGELLHQLQLIRTNSRFLAKADWYDWKLKWIEGLFSTAEKAFHELTADALALEKIRAQAEQLVPDLQREYDTVMQELEQEQEEIAQIQDGDEEYLGELRATISEQSQEVDALRNEVSESKAQIAWLQGRVAEIELQEREASSSIHELERLSKLHKNSTRSEVFRLKEELEVLQDLHMFRVTLATPHALEYDYASIFHVRIPCSNFVPIPANVEISKVPASRMRTKDDFPRLSTFLMEKGKQRVKECKATSSRQIVQLLADYWSSCTQLRSQIQHLGVKFPVEIDLAQPSKFAAMANILFPSQKAKARVSFVFDAETFARWPISVHAVTCEVDVLYGDVDSQAILDCVQRRLNQATPAEHHACLLDACMEAQEAYQ